MPEAFAGAGYAEPAAAQGARRLGRTGSPHAGMHVHCCEPSLTVHAPGPCSPPPPSSSAQPVPPSGPLPNPQPGPWSPCAASTSRAATAPPPLPSCWTRWQRLTPRCASASPRRTPRTSQTTCCRQAAQLAPGAAGCLSEPRPAALLRQALLPAAASQPTCLASFTPPLFGSLAPVPAPRRSSPLAPTCASSCTCPRRAAPLACCTSCGGGTRVTPMTPWSRTSATQSLRLP